MSGSIEAWLGSEVYPHDRCLLLHENSAPAVKGFWSTAAAQARGDEREVNSDHYSIRAQSLSRRSLSLQYESSAHKI